MGKPQTLAPALVGAVEDPTLFEVEAPPPVSLADKFLFPPLSVLDRRSGAWQERRRQWLSLGMQSELGREAAALNAADLRRDDFAATLLRDGSATMGSLNAGGTSVFDPVLCELAYRWFSPIGGRVLDPFAGGSVRGIVASVLGRDYLGVDIRAEQVTANRLQAHLGSSITPKWITGDAADLRQSLSDDDEFDLIFTCPPYGQLERYSDDPRDLSAMTWSDFAAAYRTAIAGSCTYLRKDRFAVWVVSEIRSPAGGYCGLIHETIRAFESAGLTYYNEAILIDQVGAAALFAEKQFRASRKLRRTHQVVLIFAKGDARRAARLLEDAS